MQFVVFFLRIRRPPRSTRTDTLFPYTTLFRSLCLAFPFTSRDTSMMDDQLELKNMGLKATFPRLKILDVFRKAEQRHHSAEDVYRALITEDVDIGLATVYRVLTHFEQAGILMRSQFRSEERRVGKERGRTCRYRWSP